MKLDAYRLLVFGACDITRATVNEEIMVVNGYDAKLSAVKMAEQILLWRQKHGE